MSNDIEKDLEVEEGPETIEIEKEKMLTQKKDTVCEEDCDIRNDKANFQEDYLKLRTKW